MRRCLFKRTKSSNLILVSSMSMTSFPMTLKRTNRLFPTFVIAEQIPTSENILFIHSLIHSNSEMRSHGIFKRGNVNFSPRIKKLWRIKANLILTGLHNDTKIQFSSLAEFDFNIWSIMNIWFVIWRREFFKLQWTLSSLLHETKREKFIGFYAQLLMLVTNCPEFKSMSKHLMSAEDRWSLVHQMSSRITSVRSIAHMQFVIHLTVHFLIPKYHS